MVVVGLRVCRFLLLIGCILLDLQTGEVCLHDASRDDDASHEENRAPRRCVRVFQVEGILVQVRKRVSDEGACDLAAQVCPPHRESDGGHPFHTDWGDGSP